MDTNTTGSEIERVEPPNWWAGLKNKELQLMVKEDNIAKSVPEIPNKTKGFLLKKSLKATVPTIYL